MNYTNFFLKVLRRFYDNKSSKVAASFGATFLCNRGVSAVEAIFPITTGIGATRRQKLLIKCQAALITCWTEI